LETSARTRRSIPPLAVSPQTSLSQLRKIQTRSWDDKQSGQKRYRTEIFVNDLTLLGGGEGVDEVYYRGKRNNNLPRNQSPAKESAPKYEDQPLSPDEIPF
jgi:single-strand DNA-binding protein